MNLDLTILVPRKDLSDTFRNWIQERVFREHGDLPHVIGFDNSGRDPWSFSRAINDARTRVTTSKLVIVAADYWIAHAQFERIAEVLDESPWWGPFEHYYRLDAEPTRQVLKGKDPDITMPRVGRVGNCNSVVAVRADVFDDVGGMDPLFEGRGPEDLALRHKLRVLHGEPPPPEGDIFELLIGRGVRSNLAENNDRYNRIYRGAQTPEQVRQLIAESHLPEGES